MFRAKYIFTVKCDECQHYKAYFEVGFEQIKEL